MSESDFLVKLGDYNTLKILRKTEFGLYLDGGKEGEILLPKQYVPEKCVMGEPLTVFVYLDEDERLVATTQTPLAKVGDFAYLKCTWVNQYGAFLNWGLRKDLFCPFREQRVRMRIDSSYVVCVYVDEESYRLVASSKIDKFLSEEPVSYQPGDEVDLLIYQKTDLGFKVVVENKYQGLVYDNQIFKRIHIGEQTKGFVSKVREDGKIDVSLQPVGKRMKEDFAEQLYQYLLEHDGVCNVGDKTDAGIIRNIFHVSKRVFKRSVGELYKNRVIEVGDSSIWLVGKEKKSQGKKGNIDK